MRWFFCLVFCLVTVLALAATAEMSLTVTQLVKFIQSAVQLKQPDRQVAEYLKHVKMVEKLDDQTIEDLQGQGAGPKTVAVLKELGTASASLGKAAPPPPPKPTYVQAPPPDSIEQGKIIEKAREYVRNYTKNLPNFICVQVTRRDVDPTGTGNAWRHVDTISTKLSYNQGHEDYQVVLVNNVPADPGTTMEKLGGATSAGEFGTMMRQIFAPESYAHFEWDHWGTLRGRPTYVFSYDIEQRYSQFHVTADKTLDIVPAYRGLVYIDKDTDIGMVTKVTEIPYDMPETFPIHDVALGLDYDFVKIGDAEFLLPLKSVNTSSRARYKSRNEIEFRLYRKFGTESTIKFETPEPLPDDKTKEKKQ
jgi:hypothetical protein